MERVYLTRRNLLVLLSKLDRVKAGEPSACTIIKNDTVHPNYPCTVQTMVTAVEDEDYYTDRKPGEMLPADVPNADTPVQVQNPDGGDDNMAGLTLL